MTEPTHGETKRALDVALTALALVAGDDADRLLRLAAERVPEADPAPSSSPVGDRGLDDLRVELAVTQAALHQACHDGWSDAHGAMAGYLSDARAAAADRGEPTDA